MFPLMRLREVRFRETYQTRSLSRKGSTSIDLSIEVEKVKSLSRKGNRIRDESNNGVEEIKGEPEMIMR